MVGCRTIPVDSCQRSGFPWMMARIVPLFGVKNKYPPSTTDPLMRWQDIAYRIFILGSALLSIAMIIDMLWDYQILAQSHSGSASCCFSGATFTLTIAVGVLATSAALYLIRSSFRV